MSTRSLSTVTMIVVGYNCPSGDIQYLDQLADHFGDAIFVDNGPRAHVLHNPLWRKLAPARNLGFGVAANLAAARARKPLLLFLNPDVRADVPTFRTLVAYLNRHPRLAAVGPSLAPHNSIQEANAGGADKTLANALVFAFAPARSLPHCQIWRSVFPTSGLIEIDWLSAACLMFRRNVFLEAGGFPTEYFLYDEDVALGTAIRQRGYRLAVIGDLSVSHRVGGSQPDDMHFRRWAVSNQRHILRVSPSPSRAVLTLTLICLGMIRRATWSSFLGRSHPHRYAIWALYYLLRYRLRLPPAGPDPPP